MKTRVHRTDQYKGQKRKRVTLDFNDADGNPLPCRTEQHHKDLCDITKIIKGMDADQLVQHVSQQKAFYGDFTITNEYKESLDFVKKAQDEFMELPSDLRLEFDNDPGLFLEFVSNPDNREKMTEMGLMEAPLTIYEDGKKIEKPAEKPEAVKPAEKE